MHKDAPFDSVSLAGSALSQAAHRKHMRQKWDESWGKGRGAGTLKTLTLTLTLTGQGGD